MQSKILQNKTMRVSMLICKSLEAAIQSNHHRCFQNNANLINSLSTYSECCDSKVANMQLQNELNTYRSNVKPVGLASVLQ